MTEGMEVYPLTYRDGQWWLPYGPVADVEVLVALFCSDCNVVFLWPQGGSFAFHVDEDGQDVVRIDNGAWRPLSSVTLIDWQQGALALVKEAIDQM
jgi:hypothetical protein